MPNRGVTAGRLYEQLLPAATVTASAFTRYVDTQGFDAVDFIVPHGAVTASAGANYLAIVLEETNLTPAVATAYARVAAADLRESFTSLANGVTAGVQVVGYAGSQRYVRLGLIEEGTASVTVGAIAAMLLSDRSAANEKSVVTGVVTNAAAPAAAAITLAASVPVVEATQNRLVRMATTPVTLTAFVPTVTAT